MLPSNVPEWPSEPGRVRRLARATLRPLLAVVLIGGLVGLGQTFVGLDQLVKLAVPQPASSGLRDGDSPESRNWAGYAATAGRYTAVSGTWTVPQFAPDSPLGADATWVGIGGVRSDDLVQAGTQETVTGHGRTEYQAWVETLPQVSQPVPLPISAGDSISISIEQSANEQWHIAFLNNTSGKTYDVTVHYKSSLSSAEWVVEAPSARRGRLLPLDSFGAITFTKASAVKDGQTVTVFQAGGHPITMISRIGHALASPSRLGDDGGSFSVLQSLL
jgi:peptidase A4-like protein